MERPPRCFIGRLFSSYRLTTWVWGTIPHAVNSPDSGASVPDDDNMKAIWLSVFAGCLAWRGEAQLFGPESLGGAMIGGLAGGIIGHNSGHRTGEGIAIGAGVGAVVGAIVGNERRAHEETVVYGPGYGYTTYERPNYAVSGAVVGGVAGAVIGNNSGHHTLEGAAIGAGAGLLLGSLAEQEARRRETVIYRPSYYYPAPVYYAAPVTVAPPPVAVSSTPAPAVEPQPIIRSYPGTGNSGPGMTGANSLFGR